VNPKNRAEAKNKTAASRPMQRASRETKWEGTGV
jgi:hypothetical protein